MRVQFLEDMHKWRRLGKLSLNCDVVYSFTIEHAKGIVRNLRHAALIDSDRCCAKCFILWIMIYNNFICMMEVFGAQISSHGNHLKTCYTSPSSKYVFLTFLRNWVLRCKGASSQDCARHHCSPSQASAQENLCFL